MLHQRKHECFSGLRNKIDITESKITRAKLLMIAGLKLTIGPLYIVTLIEIIRLTKKIFITEIQQEKEIRIPDKLCITHYFQR